MPDGYGVRYLTFVGREARMVAKEKWFPTQAKRTKFCEMIESNSNFIEFIAWQDPKAEDAAK